MQWTGYHVRQGRGETRGGERGASINHLEIISCTSAQFEACTRLNAHKQTVRDRFHDELATIQGSTSQMIIVKKILIELFFCLLLKVFLGIVFD